MGSRTIISGPAFAAGSGPALLYSSRRGVLMTAGKVHSSEGNTSPVRPNKPAPPTSVRKLENRPELVGSLPLWLTVGAVGHIRRFMESFHITPFADLRRRAVKVLESNLVKPGTTTVTDTELPVGRVLRKIADAMEEELASMRASLGTMKMELVQTRKQLNMVTSELKFLKLKDAQGGNSEGELARTAAQMRSLLCKEQIRAAAAEKKLFEAQSRLMKLKEKNSMVTGDLVKVSVLYTTLVAVLFSFLAESPYGPGLLRYLLGGGH